MEPKEIKPVVVYRVINRSTGVTVGTYSRSFRDEFEFSSAAEARAANCHGMFQDKGNYAIAKYRVTYELLDGDAEEA